MGKNGNGQGGHLRSVQTCGIWKAWLSGGARGQGRGGSKSTALSTLLDTASQHLVGWPHKTSETEKTACWAVPSEHVRAG